jgi:hypothetical protein
LEGVATYLLEDNTPERTQEILNGSRWIQVLGDLVATGNPITHQVLDELPQDNRIGHLRTILVHAGALDAQRDGLESLGPWLKSFLAGLSPKTAQLLRRYASWSVLPRTRHRAARLGITASAPVYARGRIETAAHFLTWLEDNDRTLADATQHDINTWIGLGASTRRRVRDFLRWAHARGLSADLQVHWLGREGLPENVLADDERWLLLRRCLRDDSLALRLRVAGALVLLYGQIPTRIVELTVDSVTTTATDTYLVLRDQPVVLPPALAALILELAARSTHEQSTSSTGNPAWLFPGARPGSHFYAAAYQPHLTRSLVSSSALPAAQRSARLPPTYRLRSSLTFSGCPSPQRRDGAHSSPGITPTTSRRASRTRRPRKVCNRCSVTRVLLSEPRPTLAGNSHMRRRGRRWRR